MGSRVPDVSWDYYNELEDPDTEAINSQIHLWNKVDRVQGGAAGGDTYKDRDNLQQIEVDVSSKYKSTDVVKAHSFDVDNPQLIGQEKIDKLEPVEK